MASRDDPPVAKLDLVIRAVRAVKSLVRFSAFGLVCGVARYAVEWVAFNPGVYLAYNVHTSCIRCGIRVVHI